MDTPSREITLLQNYLPPFSNGTTFKGKNGDQILFFNLRVAPFEKELIFQGNKYSPSGMVSLGNGSQSFHLSPL